MLQRIHFTAICALLAAAQVSANYLAPLSLPYAAPMAAYSAPALSYKPYRNAITHDLLPNDYNNKYDLPSHSRNEYDDLVVELERENYHHRPEGYEHHRRPHHGSYEHERPNYEHRPSYEHRRPDHYEHRLEHHEHRPEGYEHHRRPHHGSYEHKRPNYEHRPSYEHRRPDHYEHRPGHFRSFLPLTAPYAAPAPYAPAPAPYAPAAYSPPLYRELPQSLPPLPSPLDKIFGPILDQH